MKHDEPIRAIAVSLQMLNGSEARSVSTVAPTAYRQLTSTFPIAPLLTAGLLGGFTPHPQHRAP